MDYVALLPETILVAGAVASLLAGSFLPRDRQWMTVWVAVGATAASAGVATAALTRPSLLIFTHSYTVDVSTGVVRILASLATAVVMIIGRREFRGTVRESESATLLLLAAVGTIILSGADDLLVLATAFLLATVPLYGLIGMSRTSPAAEATMKTYLLGAIFGAVMLFGIAGLGGISGGTGYAQLQTALVHVAPTPVAAAFVAVLSGLLFKAGGVPGHFWIPDAAQSSGPSIAAFVTTVPKIGALVAIARLVMLMPNRTGVELLIAVLAALSMALGTLCAFWQSDVRRLLGWSTVGQVGFLLMPMTNASPAGRTALLLYLACYTITNLAVFAAVAALPDRPTLPDWAGAGRRHPFLTGTVVVGLLSFVGTPPTAVFAGKLAVFTAAWQTGFAWLVVFAAAVSAASLFYALRWINAALRQVATPTAGASSGIARSTAVVLGAITVSGAVIAVALAGAIRTALT